MGKMPMPPFNRLLWLDRFDRASAFLQQPDELRKRFRRSAGQRECEFGNRLVIAFLRMQRHGQKGMQRGAGFGVRRKHQSSAERRFGHGEFFGSELGGPEGLPGMRIVWRKFGRACRERFGDRNVSQFDDGTDGVLPRELLLSGSVIGQAVGHLLEHLQRDDEVIASLGRAVL